MMETKADTLTAGAASPAITAYEAVKAKEKIAKQLNHVPWKKDLKKNWIVYVLFLIPLAWLIVFHYLPIVFGIPLAFKEYNIWDGIWGSPWVGWENFKIMFTGGGTGSGDFMQAFRNTLVLGAMNLTLGFLPSTIFALIITNVRFKKYKRVCQMLTYLPNFVSGVVIVQLMQNLLADNGAITVFMNKVFNLPLVDWTNTASSWFWIWYIVFGIWQSFGYGSIIMVSSISNINGDLYEAAAIDGAGRWQKMRYISIPHLIPLVCIFTIMGAGSLINGNFDLFYVIPRNTSILYDTTDILNTYVYRALSTGNYAMGATVGLLQSLIGVILVGASNLIVKKVSPDNSLF